MKSIIEFTGFKEFGIIFSAFVFAFALVDFVVAPVQHYFVSRSTMAGRRHVRDVCVSAVTDRYPQTLQVLVEQTSDLETLPPF